MTPFVQDSDSPLYVGDALEVLAGCRLGRRSIGIELNQSYAELCARRLQQLSLEFA